MYAREKPQKRDQWEQHIVAVDPSEQALRNEYDHARTLAFQEFSRSAEGSQIYDQTFPSLWNFHKHTDPLAPHEAARQATLARRERQNFQFPEFAIWVLERQPLTAAVQAA